MYTMCTCVRCYAVLLPLARLTHYDYFSPRLLQPFMQFAIEFYDCCGQQTAPPCNKLQQPNDQIIKISSNRQATSQTVSQLTNRRRLVKNFHSHLPPLQLMITKPRKSAKIKHNATKMHIKKIKQISPLQQVNKKKNKT